jgi:hypothetical protein
MRISSTPGCPGVAWIAFTSWDICSANGFPGSTVRAYRGPHSNLSIANRLRANAPSDSEISILLRSDRHVDRVPLNQMPAWGRLRQLTPRMQMADFAASRLLRRIPAIVSFLNPLP